MYHKLTIGLLTSVLFTTGTVPANEPQPEPFLGDWQGEGLVAQVIPRGGGNYQINLLPEFDVKCEPLAVVEAQAANGVLRFDQDRWAGELKGGRFTGSRPVEGKSVAFELKKVVRLSPTLGAKPPEGAVVLFDGTGFDQWQVHRSKIPSSEIVWELSDGSMRVAPIDRKSLAGHSIATKRAFQDLQLHLEFRLPLMADRTGQARANGGVTLEDYNWYEVQILDSYGLEGRDNECGGIYKVAAPAVNMCRPPLVWQTYDIEFHAPRYDTDGRRTRPGRISVKHNGVRIHKDVELPDSPGAQKRRKANPGSVTVGRIILHYHKNPIEYRNIWLKQL
ncbi:MAG: 3-keto-disaccharide hydrolase [Planctomycetota bacterium]|jgi:hypothetical protein